MGSAEIHSLGIGLILFLITGKLSITSAWKGLNKIIPPQPESACLLQYTSCGVWVGSDHAAATTSPHLTAGCGSTGYNYIKMIVPDIKLVFSDLHQQYNLEIFSPI